MKIFSVTSLSVICAFAFSGSQVFAQVNREPTNDNLRDYAIQRMLERGGRQVNADTVVVASIGMHTRVTISVEKIGCQSARPKAGWLCDYVVTQTLGAGGELLEGGLGIFMGNMINGHVERSNETGRFVWNEAGRLVRFAP